MAKRERTRTYGIGGFIGVFVALSVLGVLMLIVIGTPGGSTEVVPAAQTVPEGYERPAGADDPDTAALEEGEPSSTTMAPAVTTPPGPSSFPDGRDAPEGVAEVLVDGGSTTLTFALPEGFAVEAATPAVPPTSADIVNDGAVLNVRASCSTSADEVLAQVSVSESADSVTLLAVVLVPQGGAPCDPGAGEVVEVPLQSPLAGRDLNVVPQGSAIPAVAAAG